MFELMPKSGGHIRPQGPRNSICQPLRKRHCLQWPTYLSSVWVANTLGAGFSAQEKSHIVQIIPQKKEANTSEQEKDSSVGPLK